MIENNPKPTYCNGTGQNLGEKSQLPIALYGRAQEEICPELQEPF